ncbi:NAD(P)-binding protein [Peniophora sp. CONT]|nr:NAD(P)-binding protein [Peniophora sp. CONT]
MSSDSRVWLVTGASSGLGLALVEAVLAKGERAVATVRKPAALDDLSKKYSADQLLVLQLDVTDNEAIVRSFDAIEKHFKRLDVVVNNAGYGVTSDIEATPDEISRPIFETLFWGPVHITQQAIRFFREVNPKGLGGRVLNISSIGGYAAQPTLSFYNAAKFALEGFTQSFTKEMPPEWNIKGVIIEPGGFPTNWSSANMVTIPPHPAYPEDSPSRKFIQMRDGAPAIGDVHRAAKAMITISEEPNPPLRLQLGTDAWGIAQGMAQKTLDEQNKWADLSHSTNQDGYGLEILQYLKGAI